MIKYQVGHYLRAEITTVDIERETSESVWINGRRRQKKSYFFDTWDEAHSYLVDMADAKLSSARRQLEHAQGLHGNIKGMKP